MADSRHSRIKEYAGGWMTEREGTEVPAFLKVAYLVIALGCIAYAVIYMNGETAHDTRGALVRELNATTQTADAFMWFVALLAVIFTVVLAVFAFGKERTDAEAPTDAGRR